MKSLLLLNRRSISCGLVILFLFAIPIIAQTFPVTINVLWDPNPASDQVTKYTITFNGNSTDIPITNCNNIECATTLVVPSAGSYTISLTATNMWATGPATTLSFTATSPGRSGNLRIRVQ